MCYKNTCKITTVNKFKKKKYLNHLRTWNFYENMNIKLFPKQ